MKQILISVEGQTEETFVREVLCPHLNQLNLNPVPIVLTTKRVKAGVNFKGGLLSYEQASKEIGRLLLDKNAIAVTTMYDYYGLPQDFPGFATRPPGSGYAQVKYLEAAFQKDINRQRFRPYFQLHEYETILFIDPQITASLFPGTNILDQLIAIRTAFPSPEEINDDPDTAPSKRILKLIPSYEKPIYGSLAAIQLGLDAIRQACLHFREWLNWLEGQ